jgi:hypothetical protein
MRCGLMWMVPVLACMGCGPTGYLERGTEVYWAHYPGSSAFPTLERVETLLDADASTFRVEPFADWASDQHNAYYRGRIAGPVHQPSFSARDAAHAADRVTVWLYGEMIDGADPASFRPLRDGYAVDNQRAYYRRTGIEACDLGSLQVVGEGIDAFLVDDECVFSGIFQAPVRDRSSFEQLGAGYARDAYQVYWMQYVVQGADPASFHVPAGMRYGVDSSGCWSGTRATPCLR